MLLVRNGRENISDLFSIQVETGDVEVAEAPTDGQTGVANLAIEEEGETRRRPAGARRILKTSKTVGASCPKP